MGFINCLSRRFSFHNCDFRQFHLDFSVCLLYTKYDYIELHIIANDLNLRKNKRQIHFDLNLPFEVYSVVSSFASADHIPPLFQAPAYAFESYVESCCQPWTAVSCDSCYSHLQSHDLS